MNNYLDNILIPTGKRYDIQKAVEKAMELTKTEGTTIHLVHVLRSYGFSGMWKAAMRQNLLAGNKLDGYLKILIELSDWKNVIEKQAPEVTVKIHIKRGFSLQPLVAQIARNERAGVVISSGHLKRQWFTREENISVIERKEPSNSPVSVTLFKTVSPKRKRVYHHSFSAKGIQVSLSYN